MGSPAFESLFSDPHLQAYATDILALRTSDGTQLPNGDLLRLARCVDDPMLAHADIHYWDQLIIDRRQPFSRYLWPNIKDRAIGKATQEDVLAAIQAAAQRVRDDETRLEQTLQTATFLD